MQGYCRNVHFRSHCTFVSTINNRQVCQLPKERTVATRHRKASRLACCFLSSWVTLPLRKRGTRFASMGGQEGGSHSPPPQKAGTQTPSLTWKGSPFILQCCASMLQRQRCPRREAPLPLQVKPSDLTTVARALCKGI